MIYKTKLCKSFSNFLFIFTFIGCLALPNLSFAEEKSWWSSGKDLFNRFQGEKQTQQKTLTIDEMGMGLKEALRVGTENVVSQLGTKGGFNQDPAIHIPLPEQLNTVKTWLAKVGLESMLVDLELKLNRAAEAATPKAKSLFLQAIGEMTLDDVKAIYQGPDDAATRYFQEKMREPLSNEMRPVIDNSLSEVGAVQSYNQVMGSYQSLPFVPDVQADLTEHALAKGLDGIFYYLAKEEAAIRKDPVKRTTDILQRVFGNN